LTITIVEETAMLEGRVRAPPSKSYTHRAVIASSLAAAPSRIASPLYADDTAATIDACISFGVSITQHDTALRVVPPLKLRAPLNVIHCQDSGSTIRFLTPVAALVRGRTVLDGSQGLRRRPMEPLLGALRKLGIHCVSNDGFPPITVFGEGLSGGKTSLVGDVSSQFVTGLLFACPLAEGETEIALTTPLESKPYVKLTLDVLKKHDIDVDASDDLQSFTVPGKQRYTSRDHVVPGDFSAAAFLLAAAAMTGSDVVVENLSMDQPDSAIVTILRRMGASVTVKDSSVRVVGRRLEGIAIDAADSPDLVPVCAALACTSEGSTHIYGAKRLEMKESNRLKTLTSELQAMGADVVNEVDGLRITGTRPLQGAVIDPHGDHRIAMACAIAGLKAKGKTQILESECVNKSYPNFFNDLKTLGGKIRVG
jgi:3-phosphoshikimate 1-carboxyvinyltransferase